MSDPLVCKACKKGTLKWVDPEVDSLDGDLYCTSCDEVYHGIGEYVNFKTKEDEGTNPKAAMGALKAPMGYCPPTAIIEMEAVMAGGGWKYGPYNFRDTKIDAMTYIGAIDRHFKLWQDGVDSDKESGRSHLAHIMACCALALDAQHTGSFTDNRHKSGLVQGILDSCAESHNKFMKENKSIEERDNNE